MEQAGYDLKAWPDARETHVGTQASADEANIARFGKKQRFKRNFSFVSVVGLSATLMLTWEGALALLQAFVSNGGPTGAFAGFIFVFAGVTTQAFVMAEIASMIPLSGGAYNWVAVLSPPKYSNFLSYMTGWVTVIAWQALTTSTTFLNATVIQALVVLTFPESYVYQQWHGTLIMFAIILMAFFVNTILGRLLPSFEATVLIVHILGFFGILFTILYLGPKNSPELVFQTFVNGGMWPTDGISFLIGAVSSAFIFTGVDAASHMAEEIENAAVVIPRAMITTVLLNGTIGLGMLIAILFTMGPLTDVLTNDFFFAFIPIFAKITGSTAAAVGMTSLILVVTISGTFGLLATTSRMLWAFAREDGVPGAKFIARIESRNALPIVSLGITAIIVMLLALINIGSLTAFNAFTNLTVAGFYSTFFAAAAVMLHKRLTTNDADMEWGPFRLGKVGIPLTVVSLMYTIVAWFFSFWPPVNSADISTFNWSLVVYFGTIAIALIWWFVRARRTYTGPKMEF